MQKQDIRRALGGAKICTFCHRPLRVGWWVWVSSDEKRFTCNRCFWDTRYQDAVRNGDFRWYGKVERFMSLGRLRLARTGGLVYRLLQRRTIAIVGPKPPKRPFSAWTRGDLP